MPCTVSPPPALSPLPTRSPALEAFYRRFVLQGICIYPSLLPVSPSSAFCRGLSFRTPRLGHDPVCARDGRDGAWHARRHTGFVTCLAVFVDVLCSMDFHPRPPRHFRLVPREYFGNFCLKVEASDGQISREVSRRSASGTWHSWPLSSTQGGLSLTPVSHGIGCLCLRNFVGVGLADGPPQCARPW